MKTIHRILTLLLVSAFFITIFLTAWAEDYGAEETTKQQAGNTWLKITYDPAVVSAATRKNAQKAADITTTLLTRYGLPLGQPVTVIVTADSEAYINAIVSFYPNISRDAVKKVVGTTLGMSIAKKNTIIVRGHPRQAEYLSEILCILPHEAFHQALRQYLKNVEPPSWLSEGSAEYFRSIALEEGGVGNVDVLVNYAKQKIQKAASIPDAHRLVDHREYNTLKERFPVYDMSQVMISRLITNMDFGKVVSFFKLLHEGIPTDKAFSDTFGVPMSTFLDEMNVYFKTQLKSRQQGKSPL